MWNLVSKANLWIHPKIKNPGINVLDLDFNEIVNFLNQEDFDIKKVDGFDRLLCDIMYNDIAPHATVMDAVWLKDDGTGEEETEQNSLTIIYNSSCDTYKFWLVEYLIELHIEMYSIDPFKHSWYLSDEMKHMDKTQNQIMRGISYGKVLNGLFPTDEEWDKFINLIFPNDVKKYCRSFVSIYNRTLNRKNLKKVIKTGFPKKKKVEKNIEKFITETFSLRDHLQYVYDNDLWPKTEKK